MSCALCERVDAATASQQGERPVYADEVAVVLVSPAPARRKEAWVIPRTHYRALAELDEKTGVHLIKLGMRAALSLGTRADDQLEVLLESAPLDRGSPDSHVHVRVYPRAADSDE
jgi:diadenosine tetraphosphate (Ap4A) HIT family hydrolase